MFQILLVLLAANIFLGLTGHLLSLRRLTHISGLVDGIYFYPGEKYFLTENPDADVTLTMKFESLSHLVDYGTVNMLLARFPDKDEQWLELTVWDRALIEQVRLPLAKGSWFDDIKAVDSAVPVVVSSKLGREYPLDRTCTIRVVLDPDGTKHHDLRVRVIGILQEPGYGLKMSGNSLEGILDLKFEGLILPLEAFPAGTYTMRYNNGTMLFPLKEKAESVMASLEKSLSPRHGELQLFTDLVKKAERQQKDIRFTVFSLGALLLIVSLAGLGGSNILSILALEKNYALYFMCGARWILCLIIVCIKDFLVLALPFAVTLVITRACNIIFQGSLFPMDRSGLFLSAALCAGIFLITSTGPLIYLYRRSPVEIIRRWA